MQSQVGGNMTQRFRIIERRAKYRVQKWLPSGSHGAWVTEHTTVDSKIVPLEFPNLTEAESYCLSHYKTGVEDTWRVALEYDETRDGELVRDWF